MANRQKGEVGFDAGGVAYKLRFDVNAICEMEDAFDASIADIGALLAQGARVSYIRTAFAIGLRQCHPDMTDVEAGVLASEIGLDVVGEKINEAFDLAYPTAAANTANPPRGATAT